MFNSVTIKVNSYTREVLHIFTAELLTQYTNKCCTTSGDVKDRDH